MSALSALLEAMSRPDDAADDAPSTSRPDGGGERPADTKRFKTVYVRSAYVQTSDRRTGWAYHQPHRVTVGRHVAPAPASRGQRPPHSSSPCHAKPDGGERATCGAVVDAPPPPPHARPITTVVVDKPPDADEGGRSPTHSSRYETAPSGCSSSNVGRPDVQSGAAAATERMRPADVNVPADLLARCDQILAAYAADDQ